jgi:hypothetical protein
MKEAKLRSSASSRDWKDESESLAKAIKDLTRRTLIQVALLFLYIIHTPPKDPNPKKRKRDKRTSTSQAVLDDPSMSLEILIDRLSVWSAVAELGVDMVAPHNHEDVQVMLQAFWTDVVKPL